MLVKGKEKQFVRRVGVSEESKTSDDASSAKKGYPSMFIGKSENQSFIMHCHYAADKGILESVKEGDILLEQV